jgi:hypothetical protein
MITKFVQALVLGLALISNSQAGEPWAPTTGYSSVSQQKAYNNFYFSGVEGNYSDEETYEHETQVYNTKFADTSGYWSSNLPQAYFDTPFLDEIDNFTIGSAQGSDIVSNKQYMTYITLKKGNNSDCSGCCSSHGGVCCNNGVTSCCDGTALSTTCVSKGCNQCLQQATVRIKGQKGHRIPSWCYSTWCIFADATTSSMCVLSAPAYQYWSY